MREARRSRQRKQSHLDELHAQSQQLWSENVSIQQNMGEEGREGG